MELVPSRWAKSASARRAMMTGISFEHLLETPAENRFMRESSNLDFLRAIAVLTVFIAHLSRAAALLPPSD
jgi:hypothetical protein